MKNPTFSGKNPTFHEQIALLSVKISDGLLFNHQLRFSNVLLDFQMFTFVAKKLKIIPYF